MTAGGCFCNKVRINFEGEPVAHILCHCLDCRKITGATYSNNIIIPEDKFTVESGTPKTITKVADTGKSITSHFCPDCGTTLYRTGESFDKTVVVKAGILDDEDWPNKNPPKGEIFAPKRVDWVKPIEGANQVKRMPGQD